ncbi:MAG: copper amine oxidase N-terminal domain-containing protein [Bacillota bacterium]|nr:copper amine oxidase N-terminal domain-containing protein [Bacillota bacterium]
MRGKTLCVLALLICFAFSGPGPVHAGRLNIGTTLTGLTGTLDGTTTAVSSVLAGTSDAVTETVTDVAGMAAGLAGTVAGTTGIITETAGEVSDLPGAVADVTGIVGDVTGVVDDLTDSLTDTVSETAQGVTDTTDDLLDPGSTRTGQPPGSARQKVTIVFRIGDPTLYVNGKAVGKMDVVPYVKQNRCFLPVRYVAYTVGVKPAGVIWDPEKLSVTLRREKASVRLSIGSSIIYVNAKPVQIDALPSVVHPGRVMLPYRWVAEAFGAAVNWDQKTNSVIIEYYV